MNDRTDGYLKEEQVHCMRGNTDSVGERPPCNLGVDAASSKTKADLDVLLTFK